MSESLWSAELVELRNDYGKVRWRVRDIPPDKSYELGYVFEEDYRSRRRAEAVLRTRLRVHHHSVASTFREVR